MKYSETGGTWCRINSTYIEGGSGPATAAAGSGDVSGPYGPSVNLNVLP